MSDSTFPSLFDQFPTYRTISVNYLGPSVVTPFLQSIETGIIINQCLRFWQHAHREKPVVKALATFVTIVAIIQTGMTIADMWSKFIDNFGDMIGALGITTGTKIQPIITLLMAAPVQGFLMWRCWVLTQQSLLLLVPLLVLYLAYFVSAIVTTVNVFNIPFDTFLDPNVPLPTSVPVTIDPAFLLSLIFPATFDVIVTIVLLWFLLRPRSTVVTRHFRKVLNRLAVIVWEAALPPCLCAIVTIITYLTTIDFSFWDLVFQEVLGQLYVISLFVTVNGFYDVKRIDMGEGAITALGRSAQNDARIEMRSPYDDSGFDSYQIDSSFVPHQAQPASAVDSQRFDITNVAKLKLKLGSSKGRSRDQRSIHTSLETRSDK